KYEKHVREAHEQKQSATNFFIGNKTEIEERASLLRSELLKVQHALNDLEMEVKQLNKDLQLQKRNKQKLVNWKVKNAQLLESLAEKVEKYERWKQYDVDKLLVELDKKRLEVQQLSSLEQRIQKKNQTLSQKHQREIEKLKKRLKQEIQLKNRALLKLGGMKQVDDHETNEAKIWHEK